MATWPLPIWGSLAGSHRTAGAALPKLPLMRGLMPRSDPSASQPLRVVLASVVGLASGLALSRSLPLVPSTLLTTLVLAGGAGVSQRLRQASRWWGLIGFAVGALVGTGWVLSLALKERQPTTALGLRAFTVLLMLGAGAIAGHGLGGPGESAGARIAPPLAGRRPADLLKAASGLTAGAFAALVTLAYVHSGLDVARAFSSRMSTSLTILVVCLAAPGWLSHQWRQQRQQQRLLRSQPFAHATSSSHAPR